MLDETIPFDDTGLDGLLFGKSQALDKIIPAMVAMRPLMKDVKKSGFNPRFNRPYSDLGDYMEASAEALASNGLVVAQFPASPRSGEPTIYVVTALLHASGQFLISALVMPMADPTPQAVGSAITYARRYMLAGAVGLAPADDDAETAEPVKATRPKQAPQAQTPMPVRKQPPEGFPWKDKAEMMDSFNHIRQFIPNSYDAILNKHQIGSEKGVLVGTKAQFLDAYNAMKALADEQAQRKGAADV